MRTRATWINAFIITMFLFGIQKSNAEEERIIDNQGIHSPIGFAQLFGSKTLQTEKFSDKELFILQVGIMDGDEGKLLRYEASSGRLLIKQIKDDSLPIIYLDRIINDKEFYKKITSLISVAPTKPISLDEASAIVSSLGGSVWLFEYIDPLGGRQSIVTVEKLPEGFDVRNHDGMRKTFENIIKYVK